MAESKNKLVVWRIMIVMIANCLNPIQMRYLRFDLDNPIRSTHTSLNQLKTIMLSDKFLPQIPLNLKPHSTTNRFPFAYSMLLRLFQTICKSTSPRIQIYYSFVRGRYIVRLSSSYDFPATYFDAHRTLPSNTNRECSRLCQEYRSTLRLAGQPFAAFNGVSVVKQCSPANGFVLY